MDSSVDILRLCRLCLVKDQVNIPIFGEEDLRNIFLKISSCLPVKISKDDDLPKKICDGCSLKLDSFYEFWTSTANAQETLLSWIAQKAQTPAEPAVPKPIVNVKQETEAVEETLEESTKDETEAPPAKRPRRSAAIKAQSSIMPESDEDEDLDTTEIVTKEEIQDLQSEYTELAGSSVDEAQPGPSGLGQDGVDVEPGDQTTVRKSTRKPKRKYTEYLNVILKESSDDELQEPKPTKLKKEDEVHACKNCNSVFNSRFALQRHKRSQECTNEDLLDEKMFTCKRCLQQFDTLKELKLHRKEHVRKEFIENHTYYFDESQELYICSTCSAEFKDEEEANRHTKSHGEVLQCSQCPAKFQTIFQLGSHLKVTHSADDQFLCPLCPELKFSKPSLFTKHIDTKHQKRYMYNCKECGKGFHSRTLCREHMNVHLGIKPFKCVVCGALFTYSKSVVTHQLKAHRVEILGKSHATECSFCRNRFVSVASLERHVTQVHSTPKPPKEKIHLCDVCGMGFAKKNKMVVHQRVHTGVKPYPCRYCERSFSKSGERNCHERIHTGERPYSCEYCGKAFRQSAPFKVHIRTHTGERPYVCDLCSKGFTTNQGLKLHKKNCSVLDYRI